MKKILIWILLIGYFSLGFILIIGTSINKVKTKQTSSIQDNSSSIQVKLTVCGVRSAMERAYFEGQRDIINGDIRIEEFKKGKYKWIKSPWDSGKEPQYKIDEEEK